MGANKRKITNEGNSLLDTSSNKVEIQNLAKDLTELCEKEYKRRFSDNKFREIFDNEKPQEEITNVVKKY